ncbi:cell division protein ZapA [Tindallia californiensis]|uniref:Cell division protein ZapA n=1 Tax=Tindallia californiensis TaxID=159292 RepID=A0A1H3IY44_9FIRM|nr:cell division protein ZapA [Tindallia californiensis]
MSLADNRNRVILKINGQEYPIVGNESKEYLIRIGTFVDEKMQDVAKNNRQLSLSMVAVLTSINIADLYLKKEREKATSKEEPPLKNDDILHVQKELHQKNQSLNQEKEHSKALQNKLTLMRKKEEDTKKEVQEMQGKLTEKEDQLTKANEVIKELQDQLYESQLQVAELQKNKKTQI